MELKSNVKNRRRDRIRQLQAGNASGRLKESAPSSGTVTFADETIEPGVSRYDKRWEDPEFVWKEREKQLFERSHRFSGGGGHEEDDLLPASRLLSPRKTIVQLLLCLILFGAVWLLFHSEGEWQGKGQAAVRRALNEEFPFARLEAWYASSFGDSASWIPAFGGKDEGAAKVTARAGKSLVSPVQGTIALPFTPGTGGVLLSTRADAPVYAMEEGRVLFAGNRQDTAYTVVVAHANGLESSYGFLQPGKWQKADWVQAGELIGKAAVKDEDKSKGKVFIALRKNNTPVNPAEVIRFD